MTHLTGKRAVAVAAFVLVVAGCSQTQEPQVRVLSVNEVDCRAVIDNISSPPDNYQTTLGVVALPDVDTDHQRGRIDAETGMRFSKMGLVVRSSQPSSITVAADQASTIGLTWGNFGEAQRPADRIDIPGCLGQADWIVFAGGIWTSEPACVRLDVSAGGSTESIRIPIGVDCP